VYQLTDSIALVLTADYITPVVDDPFLFGQVAAANALSDVYAKGGRPIAAVNLCNFPSSLAHLAGREKRESDQGIDPETMLAILQGGLSKIVEAGAALVGGHTVRDPELKYGLSVTGIIDPKKAVRNSTCRVGDKLILTKKIGTGVLITGFRKQLVPVELLEHAVKTCMAVLNRVSSETMMEFEPHACTDVTGFGLAGHALWMVKAARIGMTIYVDRLPHFSESLDLIAKGTFTGVTEDNRRLVQDYVRVGSNVLPHEETLMYDPQTSGGLFISVAPEKAEPLVAALRARGVSDAAIIGEVFASSEPVIQLRKS